MTRSKNSESTANSRYASSLNVPGYRIREGRTADGAAVGAMWRELMAMHQSLDARFIVAPDGEARYIRHAQEMTRSRDSRVLIAEDIDTGKPIGYVIGEVQMRPPMALPGAYGFISDIFVSEAWRQNGVGSALFEQMRAWFITRRCRAIELYIAEANPDSTAFWEAMGLTSFLKLMHIDL